MDCLKFEQKCPRHPEYEIELMKINNSDSSKSNPFFCCLYCISSIQQFNINDYISIKYLIQSGLNEILSKWPPVNNTDILTTLSQLVNNNTNSEQLIEQIIAFFQGLKQSINESIDSCQKYMIQRVQNLPKSSSQNAEILRKYQDISKINDLRQHLLNNNNNIQQKENLCSIIINEKQQNIQNTTKQIQSLLQNNPTQLIVDFKPALLIQEQIIQNIKNIELFSNLTQNIQQLSQQNKQINELSNINQKISVNLVQTNLNKKYVKVQISHNTNKQPEVVMLSNNYWSNIVSDIILDSNKSYIFRLKIHSSNKKIMIGLIREENQHSQLGNSDKLSFYFMKTQKKIIKFEGDGIDERLKGNDDLELSDEMTLELRININKKILHITDYPHYQFKFGLSQEYIEKLNYIQYRFYLGIVYEDTKITLTDSFIVNEFQ